MGYIKRQPAEVYNIQKRGGRGVSGMKQRDEDFVDSMFIASSHENILFITNKGNMFRLKCYQIPEGSKQSRGMNIVNLLQLSEEEKVAAMMTTIDFADNKYFICLTKNGLVKRTKLLLTVTRSREDFLPRETVLLWRLLGTAQLYALMRAISV